MSTERRDYGATHVDQGESMGELGEAADRLTGKDDEDYDPHLHRKVERPTNNLESLVHLLKCSLGTGILAMPQAFARAGVVAGSLGTLVAGVLVTHCLHMLVRAQYKQARIARVPLMSYPDAAAAALTAGPAPLRPLARPAALTVDIFLVVYQLGICCVYIVFIAGNIKKLVDPYYELSVEYHMLIILGPLIAFNLIPNLKILAPFSLLANVLTLLGLAIIVYFLVAEPRKSDTPLELWGPPAEFPLFFGTALFALTAVGVVVAIENNMKTPKKFGGGCGVLNVGMGTIVVLYLSVGIVGYNFCRDSCSDSITLDMPKDSWLASAVVGMFAVAIFISYGLQCYVPVEVVWSYVRPRLAADASEARLTCAKYAVRIVLALITFVAAVSVPRLGLFISLFGALCLSALGLVFPAAMQALATRSVLTRIKDLVIAVVGLLVMVLGTYSAVVAIVRSFQ